MIRSRGKFVLLLLAYAAATSLLEFTYRYLDIVSRQRHESWRISFIEQATGCYAAIVIILLAIFRCISASSWRDLSCIRV
jgi:hypothetical protein